MSGFGHTLAGLCDGVSSIYAIAASSYCANGNINGRAALIMCLLRSDLTYDGRAYANPNEMLRIAEKSPCVSTDIRQIPTVPRPESRFSPAWATAIRRCREPRSEEEQAEALAQAEYEDDLGIERDPATYTILRAQNAEDAKREAEEQCAVSQRLTRSATI